MFTQLLTPVGDSLGLSFVAATLPVVALLRAARRLAPPGLAGRRAGLIVGLAVAVFAWKVPLGLAVEFRSPMARCSRCGR